MQNNELIARWKREERKPFAGWDFSYLEGKMLEEEPPWSYMERAATLLRAAASALDMGTGGGERLLALQEYWPPKMVVTEDYPPNVKLASERLAPLGVCVKVAELTYTSPLPFADGEFTLVLNRHSGFNVHEVARVLTPGGIFFTQQIHGLWGQSLLALFGATPQWPEETLDHSVDRLESAGLLIATAEDWQGTFSFTDVGAVVYYLKAVPWLVPGFSVETHLKPLLALQERLDRGESLSFEARKYLIEAHKS
ncbi:MAG: methyltransferase domain-containing protein [Anaerolineae bacterium]|nr:methyltransferase domain-containing protein [Anaerolineae bacterium]